MTDGRIPARTRVLVVGGGPVGLVVSGLLSQRGVEHVVVERRADTLRAPAAHVMRRRPMQILDRLGVGDEVRRAAPPMPLDFVTWCATLGGAEVGRLDLRPVDPRTGERGAEPWTNCSQNLLEPILLRHASSQPQARLAHAGGAHPTLRGHRGTAQPFSLGRLATRGSGAVMAARQRTLGGFPGDHPCG